MNPHEIWNSALSLLRSQMSPATFETWLKPSEGLAFDEETLLIGVANNHAKQWLTERLNGELEAALETVAGQKLAYRFVTHTPSGQTSLVEPSPDQETSSSIRATNSKSNSAAQSPNSAGFQQSVLPDPGEQGPIPKAPRLNPRYNFDTFVVGSGNRLAHAAAQAVAEHPAERYNPLFIYGGVGLGKTHLLHAIASASLARGKHVIVISSETFTNELINSIRNRSTEEFRGVYRAADVLLVDDIHFIAGKESTQEEFFHTFNAVHGAGGQIIMSSDRPPQAISTLEDRLRSRFQWGLQVDIEPPDLETRIAILRDKNARHPQPVSDRVLALIASAVQRNVRELEGALNRVVAYAHANGLPLNEETATKALSDLMIQRDPPDLETVIDAVALYFGLDKAELLGRGRAARISEPRQIAMYLMREETESSFPAIGNALGGRDHTTVLHGCDKISRLIDKDPKLRRDILQLREKIYAD